MKHVLVRLSHVMEIRHLLGIAGGLFIITMLMQLRPAFVDATITASTQDSNAAIDSPAQAPPPSPLSARSRLLPAPIALPIALNESLERDLTAKHAAVIDAVSGKLVGGRDETTAYPMASLTKLLAALVLVDRVAEWKQLVEIVPADVREGEVVVHVGDRLELYDLFVVTLMRSSNTGIEALARSTGLTRERLAAMMNAFAQTRGWTSVYVTDPTGLAPTTVASAADIARILAAALSRREIVSALEMSRYQWSVYAADHTPLKQYSAISTNELIHPSADTGGYSITGGKTGYIPESMYNIAVEAVNAEGQRRIAVILGASTFDRRFTEADALLSWSFDVIPAQRPTL